MVAGWMVWQRTRAVLVALALAAALLGPAGAHAQEMMEFNQAQLVRRLLPSVVNITARAEIGKPLDTISAAAQEPSQQFEIRVNAGSGFIVDPDGTIVTNWHVVDSAFEIYATFSDGSRVRAEVVNAARLVDIAVLKVDAGHKLSAVTWGDSAHVQVGDPVLAIGNPLGVGLSVSAGIVSALNRNLMDTPYDDFIQTDAAINHGNSGGPLFDMKGRVIGINTALISPTTGSAGLGFAIPSNDARFVIDRLRHYGWVRPGWLGVKVQQMTPDMAVALGMADPEGSVVAWVVAGGPAAAAGMHLGDVIVRFGDEVPTDERALLRAIAASPPGLHVTLGLLRDGKPLDLPVTLAEWPKMQWEERDAPTRVAQPHWQIPPDLGLTMAPLTPEMRASRDLPPGVSGVIVLRVSQDADAIRRGIGDGDVILEVDDKQVATAEQVQQAIDAARAEQRRFALFLVLPKNAVSKDGHFPGPKWIALRIMQG